MARTLLFINSKYTMLQPSFYLIGLVLNLSPPSGIATPAKFEKRVFC
jgi:hypothetical protein